MFELFWTGQICPKSIPNAQTCDLSPEFRKKVFFLPIFISTPIIISNAQTQQYSHLSAMACTNTPSGCNPLPPRTIIFIHDFVQLRKNTKQLTPYPMLSSLSYSNERARFKEPSFSPEECLTLWRSQLDQELAMISDRWHHQVGVKMTCPLHFPLWFSS